MKSVIGFGNDADLMDSVQVRTALGNICEMTFWRWCRDLGFPPPDFIINRRKRWRRETVQRWLATQSPDLGAAKTTTTRPPAPGRKSELAAVTQSPAAPPVQGYVV